MHETCSVYAANDGNIVRYLPSYSTGLVRLLLRTVRKHLRDSGELNDVDQLSAGPIPSAPTFDEAWLDTPEAVEMEESLHYDNISGKSLPTEAVTAARQEEVQWIHKIRLYDKVPRTYATSSSPRRFDGLTSTMEMTST